MNSKHQRRGAKQPSPVPKGKVRLYSNRFCPYSQRVILVLEAKKIPYELVNINLNCKPEWIYDKVPEGRIPALELDTGDVLYESTIIVSYLDEKYRHHRLLQPKNPLQKAKEEILLREFSSVVNALLKVINCGWIDTQEKEIIQRGLLMFDNELRNRPGPYFGGNKPGLLDYMIWPWCERSEVLKMYGKDYNILNNKYKNLLQWRQLMIDDSAVKFTYCDAQTHIEYLKSFKAGFPSYDFVS